MSKAFVFLFPTRLRPGIYTVTKVFIPANFKSLHTPQNDEDVSFHTKFCTNSAVIHPSSQWMGIGCNEAVQCKIHELVFGV